MMRGKNLRQMLIQGNNCEGMLLSQKHIGVANNSKSLIHKSKKIELQNRRLKSPFIILTEYRKYIACYQDSGTERN